MRPDLVIVASTTPGSTPADELSILDRLSGRALVVARDTPILPDDPLRCLAVARNPDKCVWPLEKSRGNGYPRTPNSALPGSATVVDLSSIICPQGVCRAVTDGRLLMVDSQHLTARFSVTLAGTFTPLLERAGRAH
jgi:hypothetical protein